MDVKGPTCCKVVSGEPCGTKVVYQDNTGRE